MFLDIITNAAAVILLVITFTSCGMDLYNNTKFEGEGVYCGNGLVNGTECCTYHLLEFAR